MKKNSKHPNICYYYFYQSNTIEKRKLGGWKRREQDTYKTDKTSILLEISVIFDQLVQNLKHRAYHLKFRQELFTWG